MDAAEAKGLHLVNEVVPRQAVLDQAVAIAERVSSYNPSILRLGRDLYYNMRNMSPAQALEESGFALVAALGAEDFLLCGWPMRDKRRGIHRRLLVRYFVSG